MEYNALPSLIKKGNEKRLEERLCGPPWLLKHWPSTLAWCLCKAQPIKTCPRLDLWLQLTAWITQDQDVLRFWLNKERKGKKQQYCINDKVCNGPHVLAWKPEHAAASLGLTFPSPSRLSEMDRPPNSRTPLRSPVLPQLCEPFSWTGGRRRCDG